MSQLALLVAQTSLQQIVADLQEAGLAIIAMALVVGALAFMIRSHRGIISHTAFVRIEAAVLAAIGLGAAPMIIGMAFGVKGL